MRRIILTLILSLGFVLLLAGSLQAQESATLNTDVLREQIKKLEAVGVDGKSGAVEALHRSALLGLLKQLQLSLDRDIQDLKRLQEIVGTSIPDTRRQILDQLGKLDDEKSQLATKIQNLNQGLQRGVRVDVTESKSTADSSTSSAEPPVNGSESASRSEDERGPSERSSSDGLAMPAPSNLRGISGPTAPQAGAGNPSTSLNALLNAALQARIQQRETTNQTDTPSLSNNSSSLVDTSSAGDLINVGLSLAGLTGTTTGNNSSGNAVSVTTSAYALYAAFKAVDPLSPHFYNQNAAWRKFSFTLGYDDEKKADGSDSTRQAKIFGVKYLIINKRDPALSSNKKYFNTISDNLLGRTVAFGGLFERVSYHVLTNKDFREKVLIPQFKLYLQVKRGEALQTQSTTDPNRLARIDNLIARTDHDNVFILDKNGVAPGGSLADVKAPDLTEAGTWKKEENDFWHQIGNDYLAQDFRAKLKAAAGDAVLQDLDSFVNAQLSDAKVFEALQESKAVQDALANIRRAPQLSLYFLTKQRPQGDDEYTGEGIFDYGVADRVNLVLNGNYLYKNSKLIGGDTRVGKFSGQFRFQITPEKLLGRNPLFFFVSADGEARSGRKPLFQAQAKLSIPILNGLDLPFSLTYASRNETSQKSTFKVQFGFGLDTSRILQALLDK